jgi:uncharacterized membrane protein
VAYIEADIATDTALIVTLVVFEVTYSEANISQALAVSLVVILLYLVDTYTYIHSFSLIFHRAVAL